MIFLVACVGEKLERRAPAKELYISSWFKKARRFVEDAGQPWYILSALYGLVPPDEEIDPYEQTLNKMTKRERDTWAENVQRSLDEVEITTVIFLAGVRYREGLTDYLEDRNVRTIIPMEGLGIGKQLRWLTIKNPQEFVLRVRG